MSKLFVELVDTVLVNPNHIYYIKKIEDTKNTEFPYRIEVSYMTSNHASTFKYSPNEKTHWIEDYNKLKNYINESVVSYDSFTTTGMTDDSAGLAKLSTTRADDYCVPEINSILK